MATSILTSIKKNLGLVEDYVAFDADILLLINSVLATLNQIGIGPEAGFAITDKVATWDDFLGPDPKWNMVPNYVYIRVRLIFDPPTNSFLVDALKEQVTELEYRISALRELNAWVNPNETLDEDETVLDGGSA